jgi:hypothetical protein
MGHTPLTHRELEGSRTSKARPRAQEKREDSFREERKE